MQISQSDVVLAREARWRVIDIRIYERCQILTLAGLGPTNGGFERRMILPFDIVEPVRRRARTTRISRRLWRRALRALIAADAPPGTLTRAGEARIDLLPHQLEPALAVVRGLGSRVLLADDVGLGKTIQAGLIVSELRAKGVADRILVVSPAGLREQWADELSTRFAIDAVVLDAGTVRRSAATLPVGVNPWLTVPVVITSVDYIKRPEVLAAAAACRWDVVVLDEAHAVAGFNDRHHAISALTARAPFVVLLTATPHSGDRRAFAALCGIGAVAADRLLTFRRGRNEIHPEARRRVHHLHVRLNHDEARMHALLERLSRAVRAQHADRESASDYWIALSVLHKRAISSARSLQHSVERRLASISSKAEPGGSQLLLPLDDPDGELTPDDDVPPWSQLLSLRDSDYERRLLQALATAAARAARRESKIAALARLLRRVNEPAIVFTEYRDTLQHLQQSLHRASLGLHGGMPRDERRAAVRGFTCGDVRLLLATDAASEGLNLQQTCRLVINLELPWNPMRLEQRIGRVDRIGQRRAVHVFHLIARDSHETTVLARLRSRVAAAWADVGGSDPLANETPIARSSIGDQSPATPLVDVDGKAAEAFWAPSLASEAKIESRRIAAVRTLTKPGDKRALRCLDGLGPFVTAARHWRTRASLRDRTLQIWTVAAEDQSGRRVGATLAAVAVPISSHSDDDVIVALVERATAEWRQRILIDRHAFTGTRLERLNAIASSPPPNPRRPSGPFQPGLFEHRAARMRLAVLAAQDDLARKHRDDVDAIERAASVVFLPPQLLLVLEP